MISSFYKEYILDGLEGNSSDEENQEDVESNDDSINDHEGEDYNPSDDDVNKQFHNNFFQHEHLYSPPSFYKSNVLYHAPKALFLEPQIKTKKNLSNRIIVRSNADSMSLHRVKKSVKERIKEINHPNYERYLQSRITKKSQPDMKFLSIDRKSHNIGTRITKRIQDWLMVEIQRLAEHLTSRRTNGCGIWNCGMLNPGYGTSRRAKKPGYGTRITKRDRFGARVTKKADFGERITKKGGVGARVTRNSNVGNRITKKGGFGSRVTKKHNLGTRLTKRANFGTMITPILLENGEVGYLLTNSFRKNPLADNEANID